MRPFGAGDEYVLVLFDKEYSKRDRTGPEKFESERRLVVKLKAMDGVIALRETETSKKESPFTGRQLRVVEGNANAAGKREHEVVYSALNEREPLVSVDDQGKENGSWRSRVKQYSISDGRYVYTVVLNEVEMIQADRLILGKRLELKPYHYEESEALTDTGVVEIRCRVEIAPDETERLFEFMNSGDTYFPVVREGVTTEPRVMRFGRCTWSRDDEANVDRHALLLIDRAYDDHMDSGKTAVGLGSDYAARAHLAFEMEYLRGALDLLEEKDVITHGERQQLVASADSKAKRREMDFCRVSDIDEVN